MPDLSRDDLVAYRDRLLKEKEEFLSVINQLNVAVGQHREGLLRTEGALTIVEKLLAGEPVDGLVVKSGKLKRKKAA